LSSGEETRTLLTVGVSPLFAACVGAALILSGAAAQASDDVELETRWTLQRLGFARGAGINDRGVVAGATLSDDLVWRSYIVENGRRRDLGTLGGEDTLLPTADNPVHRPERGADVINNRGQVVGQSNTAADEFKYHAFLWQDGAMVDLGTLGGPESEAVAVNERGEVIGRSDTAVVDEDEEPVEHGFVWSGGKMHDVVGDFAGSAVYVSLRAINDRGQAIGSVERRARPWYRGFLWANGKVRDIGSLGGFYTYPKAINNRGQIAGNSSTRGRDAYGSHAFLWQSGRMRDLGVWVVVDMNERGQIVGRKRMSNGRYRAVLWQNGKLRDLGVLPGDRYSEAIAINERGQIIGVSYDSRFHNDLEVSGSRPFLWERGRMRALPGLRAREEATVMAINNRGEILGEIDGRGPVLWRPVP
jgi:probable HAF family extracellular repeat protein